MGVASDGLLLLDDKNVPGAMPCRLSDKTPHDFKTLNKSPAPIVTTRQGRAEKRKNAKIRKAELRRKVFGELKIATRPPLPKIGKIHDDDESCFEDKDYWYLPRKDWDDWVVRDTPSEYIDDLSKSLKTCMTLGDFKTKFAEANLNETQTDPVKARQFTDFLLGVEKSFGEYIARNKR